MSEKFIQQKLLKEFDKLMHNQKIELETFALGPDAYEVGEA